ncbi:UNKNOWN [Stylonychia lemnae]|uniref:Uncharacterized protein n=1 Tax=Stylonychia lemnae TaxID=5949 RepID=A0A078A5K7_STYLE|nr:UNKNOWN [Stylonychia lemnae]|eukprot:CDW77459.1 UNKNOWN [Stylonychia lemnae]
MIITKISQGLLSKPQYVSSKLYELSSSSYPSEQNVLKQSIKKAKAQIIRYATIETFILSTNTNSLEMKARNTIQTTKIERKMMKKGIIYFCQLIMLSHISVLYSLHIFRFYPTKVRLNRMLRLMQRNNKISYAETMVETLYFEYLRIVENVVENA